MPRPFAIKRGRAAMLASLCGALLICSPAHGSPKKAHAPTFESAFSAQGEPPTLHFTVKYAARDGLHTMQVWRDGESRLRRRTDDAVDTYVIRDASDPTDYQMIVVDYDKRITTRIDRNNLVRLGRFSDWFDLSHGLRHPVGAYRIVPAEAPPNTDAPLSSCRWYGIEQAGETHRVCWSEKDRLPLVIWSGAQGVVWRVTAVDRERLPRDTFQLHDAGFVRNDANAELDND